jgi:hypothetical protein
MKFYIWYEESQLLMGNCLTHINAQINSFHFTKSVGKYCGYSPWIVRASSLTGNPFQAHSHPKSVCHEVTNNKQYFFSNES